MGKGWNSHGKGTGNDIASIRGHPAIIATCDAAREKESTKELINLIHEAIEILYPNLNNENTKAPTDPESSSSSSHKTNAELLKEELNFIKSSSKSVKHNVTSINTGTKGFIMVKFINFELCPLKITISIFERIAKEKLPLCRNIVRIIPLMRTFYPSIDELTENTKILMREFLNQEDSIAASEGAIGSSCLRNSPINEIENGGESKAVNKKESEDQNNTEHNLLGKRKLETEDNNSKIEKENVTSKPDNPIKMLAYSVLFKRRNHNTLERTDAQNAIRSLLPQNYRVNYNEPELVILVEVIQNVCGISYVFNYQSYEEFNIRKFSTKVLNQSDITSQSGNL